LQLLNQLFDLRISPEQLAEWSLELGSDCPFFLFNKPAFAHGRGEQLIPLEARLKGMHILIVHPGIHVSTAWAFQSITLKKHHSDLKTIYAGPMERWQHDLVNDFEEPVFSAFPIIGSLKQQMLDAGAMYASMSGSGSSVFGIFHQEANIPMQTDHAHRWMKLS
jgi:4-diphosphocytidyl-2-C-methyl-D-erythritol kinase